MESVFLKLVNMSITASYLILAVIVFRVVLKKAPKYIRCILWGLVALRLIFPFSIESVLSLIPSTEPLPEEFLYAATPKVNTGIPAINNAINPVVAQSLTPVGLTSANPTQIWSFIFSRIWVMGMVLMLLYAVFSYLQLRRRVSAFVPVGKSIRLCDHIGSPFILGLIRPKIYLPSDISQETADHVLAHEMAHIARKDHWWKPLGYLLLTVYWFNPLIWVAYILLCRDIELACDERAIKTLDPEEKKAYSSALLRCSIPRHMIAACPLAFGEVGVKSRIKSVLNYKKPAFWVVAVAVVVSVIVGICFLTDPAGQSLTKVANPTTEGLESICVINGTDSYLFTDQKRLTEAVDTLKEIQVSRREISRSRSEDRDKTNSIELRYESTTVTYYFNAERTEIWIDDGVKPTLTYEVKNPEQTDWFFTAAEEAPVFTEYFEIDRLLGQNIALSFQPEKGEGWITLSSYDLTVTDGAGNILFNGNDPTITSSTWSRVSNHLAQDEQVALHVSVLTEENGGDASVDILEYFGDGEMRYTIYCMQDSPKMIYDGLRLYALIQTPETVEADSDRLAVGTYIPVECLYMNPASSYFPGNLSEDYTYKVTEEGFYTDSLYFICNTSVNAVDWGWKSLSEAREDVKFLIGWLASDWAITTQATITLSKDALYQKLDENNHLLLQNGELLMIHGGTGRNEVEMVWGIYKLEMVTDTSASDNQAAIGENIEIPFTIEELAILDDIAVYERIPALEAESVELITTQIYDDLFFTGFRYNGKIGLGCYEKRNTGSYELIQFFRQEDLLSTEDDLVYRATVNTADTELCVLICLNENITAVKWNYSNDALHIVDYAPSLIVYNTADNRFDGVDAEYEFCYSTVSPFPYSVDENGKITASSGTEYINGSEVVVYDGTQRPGYYEQSCEEITQLVDTLKAVPLQSITPGLGVEDYHINIILNCNNGTKGMDSETLYVELRYADGVVDLIFHRNTYWPSIDEGDYIFQIRDEWLNSYMESLADHPDMSHGIIVHHWEDTTEYSHRYTSMKLSHLVGWEYEIVEYTDELSPFGIRCRPEWEDDGWIFLSFWPNGFEPGNEDLTLTEFDEQSGVEYILAEPADKQADSNIWTYMKFTNLPGDYVILNEGAEEWIDETNCIVMSVWEAALAQEIITLKEVYALANAAMVDTGYKAYHAEFDYTAGIWSVSLCKDGSDALILLKYDTKGNPIN